MTRNPTTTTPQVRVVSIDPVYPRRKPIDKSEPEKLGKQVCLFCRSEGGGSMVFTEGAFLVKGGKNGKLVDRYRGSAHLSCIENHRKDWYAKNQERMLRE